mmetsp:Transcript_19919/g.49710  ORF Transcript_19919/g.49710 Transcript_19919/m.49710 type:complete len:1953 (-) Transcript_19919:135-5993(-)
MPPVVAPRPVSPAAAMAAKNAAVDKPVLRVSTQSKNDEIGIQTLVGDYLEKGTNHGKKFYQKTQKIAGHEDIDVFLYYWDARDGADFSGWWFGDQVGGSQVWARNPSHGPNPPRVGWRVPWDAPSAQPGLLFVDPVSVGASSSVGPPAAPPPPTTGPPSHAGASPAASQARVKQATQKVDALEASCREAMKASKALTPDSDEEEVAAANGLLQQQQTALVDMQKTLTQDITEARKGGISATGLVTELSKLSPRLRALQAGLAVEATKVKSLLQKLHSGVVDSKRQAEQAKELEESLPPAKEAVASAEDSVEAVAMMAAPLIEDPPEDDADLLKKALEEVEFSANDAQNKITEARSQINVKLQGARKFAPETRKAALTEFSALQQKLTETQKKLNPYKNFQKEFKARVQARKALQALTEKLTSAELEVEKAKMMSAAAERGQMTEDEISSTEKVVEPAKTSIDDVSRSLEQKLRTADGALKDELVQMKTQASALKKNADSVLDVLRKQREGLATVEMLQLASQKVDTVEERFAKCQEAEMPFLKGLEVLPGEESSKAISACESTARKTESALHQARSFLKSKTLEAKRYTQEVATRVTDELKAHETRLEGLAKKVETFRKETTERKMAALMAEVVDAVCACEKKVEVLVKVAEVLTSDDLEAVSSSELKEAIEKAGAAEQEASASMSEVRKIFAAKQREAKGPDFTAALAKVKARMDTCQQDLSKMRKAAGSGERLIKGKEVLSEEEEKVKQVEENVTSAEKKLKPGEEEAALGIEAAQPTDAEIEEMSIAFTSGQKTLKASQRVLEANTSGAPASLKAPLQKLIDRCKTGLSKISEFMAMTKDQRELVMSRAYVREAKAKADEVDKGVERVNQAELPFLKGIEVLALNEATTTIAESEAASAALQSSVSTARTFIASKNLEIKHFGAAASKSASEEFAQLTERINTAAAKLGQFKKDTEGRKKTALMQEASEKVSAAEAAVKKMAEAAEPFKDGETDMAEEECEKLVDRLKETQDAVAEANKLLADKQRDMLANAAHKDTFKELQTRLRETKNELGKHQRVASKYEKKYAAKRLLKEANDTLAGMDEEVKKAKQISAPLLEEGGAKFLVAASVRTLAAALRDHMKDKELTHEGLHSSISDGMSHIPEDKFVAYLESLPEALSREELAFTSARRVEIFKYIDTDEDGSVSQSEFKAIFLQKFICVKEITLTDGFEVVKGKTQAKIEPGTMLETYHGHQTDPSNGMMRIECTDVANSRTGFVTMEGNKGTKFIDLISPFTTFCKDMDKGVYESIKNVAKVSAFLNDKIKELDNAGRAGPLAEARAELVKLKPKVATAQENLRKMRAKAAAAKKDFEKKELAERNAHIVARERKEAEAITSPTKAKVELMEAAVKALEEAAKPLFSLSTTDLNAFASPLATSEELEKLHEACVKSIEEVKASVSEQLKKLPEEMNTSMAEAKKELQKMLGKSAAVKKQGAGVMGQMRAKLQSIVDARSVEVSGLLRKETQQKGLSFDQLFLEVVTPGDERISEAAFCKYVQGIQGETFPEEQIALLCRHLEKGGVGRRRFQAFLQKYFKVVKSIAITDGFDISKAKTLRKAEPDELVELLEGPSKDEKSSVMRIRGKSLADGTEGWISLKGNQGTPFLEEVEKPFYSSQMEIPLQREFKMEDEDGLVRTLKADEVLELVEGPRKQVFEPALRVRGKASSDGAMGWFTVRDKKGAVFAEADGKYYSCTSSVAMTDNMDIKECKVIRKLAVGELFTVEEGPIEEKEAGITRVKGKAMKDDVEGWVTVKGNLGTVYAEASTKHYCVLQDMPLTKRFTSSSSGEEVRKLEKGEAMQVLEGPKEQSFPPETRFKGKALSDGAVGWVTITSKSVKSWTPFYKCKVAAPLHDQIATEGATVVRQVEVAEALELLEGPVHEGNELRMKARAEKDSAVGWVTIKDGEGKRLFES